MTPEGRPASASRAGTGSPVRETWPQPVVFWRDKRVTIYHGDALDVLPALPPASASAVITDPPYMINALSMISTAAKAGTWADLMNATRWYAAWYAQCSRIEPARHLRDVRSHGQARIPHPQPVCPRRVADQDQHPRAARPPGREARGPHPSHPRRTRPPARRASSTRSSGTVAAAARAAGLACTGIEAEERWCQVAARRLAVPSPAR